MHSAHGSASWTSSSGGSSGPASASAAGFGSGLVLDVREVRRDEHPCIPSCAKATCSSLFPFGSGMLGSHWHWAR
ncbi:hypothetical protein GLX27_003583 [Malassezia furfur]|uniref:Uncharacterized protein n=1 Tax=Malassezia furfur TaxID=55194 RepID=A0ABY8ETI8_MALFU|nr:hypothetical protein GLX27_003583 [Malassezia furfur]